ncbi:PREDICTED: putative F-box protein At1g23770 [Camelina sativa]|uniref:F-box protein At1g23770 n=1 Tax=Camelina sativa TaxID=90675 RepID=A0ABM0YIT7_CAMSA|nr:PREDICTED: putative F-box protein At1g23770 [Camelina sativa]
MELVSLLKTRETLNLELADTATLNNLRRHINPTAPFSVHLSLNRKEELLARSPEYTLRSLGVTSGDRIYYTIDQSAFIASLHVGESSNWNLGDEKTQDQVKGSEPMDVEMAPAPVSKRLSTVPSFLRKTLLEKSGNDSRLTFLVLSVHAVMLESGFLLLDHDSDDKFSVSKKLLSVSLRYSLSELISRKDNNSLESVTLQYYNIGPKVVVYGTISGSRERVRMTYLDKRSFVRMTYVDKCRFAHVINLVLDTLKFEKESSSIDYRDVLVFWRMVKDDLVIPLLTDLCDKVGLEPPPCLMQLPTKLKRKILELLPGVSIGKMACVCTEMRYLASDDDLWKQKCLEEAKDFFWALADEVGWKCRFADFWGRRKGLIILVRGRIPQKKSNPRIENPFNPLGIHLGRRPGA